jgi:hypothetical protein
MRKGTDDSSHQLQMAHTEFTVPTIVTVALFLSLNQSIPLGTNYKAAYE